MVIIGTQNLLTGPHVKTTRYCIEVAASAICLKLIEAHRRLPSDLEPIKWLEEIPCHELFLAMDKYDRWCSVHLFDL